jgi:hypothetical protein
LLEPQRTNLALSSEEINNTGFWQLTNSGTITANSTISPDGYQNADTLNAGAAFSQVQGTILGTSGVVYTVSIWVKRITGTGNVFLRAVENANTLIAVTSDWQRFTATVTSTTTTIRIGINLATSGDAVAVWGGQIEAGSYATSYIPTQGAISTKVADVCSQTPQVGVIGQTEGVIYLQVGLINNNNSTNATKWFMEIRKDANNSFGIGSGGADVAPTIRFVTKISGVASTDAEPAGFSNSKIAIQYTSSNFKIYQNGSLKATINKNIGNYSEIEFMQGAAVDLKMPIKDIRVYNEALTDAELISLTTYKSNNYTHITNKSK